MGNAQKYDFIIVGSGASGATLAKDLSSYDKKVIVLERGRRIEEELGNLSDAIELYKPNVPLKSKEGIIIWRSFAAGGSTVVSCGNGIKAAEEMLSEHGIDLHEYFKVAEKELGVIISDSLVSEEANKIREAGKQIGYDFKTMPKFIVPNKCTHCGNCVIGCKYGARWSAFDFLKQAINNGAEVLYNTMAERIIVDKGKAIGVTATNENGALEITGDVVILAAGGMETPKILRRSGIEGAGESLFLDLFINTYGTDKSDTRYSGVQMSVYYESDDGFIISPFGNKLGVELRFIEMGMKGVHLKPEGLLSVMTKIADDNIGGILPNGRVTKTVTEMDHRKLDAGYEVSKELLIKAGALEETIVRSKIQGAHPGGTAAIGNVVDKDLQTVIDNLFVCDASVFPYSLGKPPILAIVALAKRLGKALK